MIKSCQELERLYGRSKCKCAQYRKHFSKGECECQSVSKYSPRPVEDRETLIRLVSPHQVAKGRVDPLSLAGTDGRGVSVIRRAYVSKKELLLKRELFASKHNVAVGDVLLARTLCRKVRGILWNGKPMFHIYDTAGETDWSHADICRSAYVVKGTPRRKAAIREGQDELAACFGLLPDETP